MTDFSYNWLNYWVIVLKRHEKDNWLFAQGYFQYIYLEYIQTMSGVFLPFDCAQHIDIFDRFGRFETNYTMLSNMKKQNGILKFNQLYTSKYNIHCSCYEPQKCVKIGKNGLKNICYVKALKYLDLDYNNDSSRSFGDVCLLPGLTTRGRFNTHDFGVTIWDDQKKTFAWSISDSCSLYGLYFYHGKNSELHPKLVDHYRCAYLRHFKTLPPLMTRAEFGNSNCSYLKRRRKFEDRKECIHKLVRMYRYSLTN